MIHHTSDMYAYQEIDLLHYTYSIFEFLDMKMSQIVHQFIRQCSPKAGYEDGWQLNSKKAFHATYQ